VRFSKFSLPRTNRELCPNECEDFIKYTSDFQSVKSRAKSSFHPCGKRDGRMVASTRKADDALAGINIDAVGKYSESLACPICQLPAFAGVMIKTCAHHFHARCLSKATVRNKRCPVCRSAFEAGDAIPIKDVKEARFLCQSLDELKVQCPMGCSSQVKWECLEAHLRDDCTRVEVYCKYGGCKVKGGCKHVLEHEASCGEALVECECGESFYRKAIDEHKSEECPLQPVSCKFCGQKGIARSLMKSHLAECSGSVPMSMVAKLMDEVEELKAQIQEVKRQRIQ